MLFDQVPPDTSSYMVAGYAIFFIVTAIYLASLFVRTRNLNRDIGTLAGIEQENGEPAAAPGQTVGALRARANKTPSPRKGPAAGKAAGKPAASKKPGARKRSRKK